MLWQKYLIKFSFSKKATKIWKNLPHVLMLLIKNSCFVKTSGRFFPILWPTHNVLTLTIRKWLAKHGWELHPKPKFLVTANEYLSATFGPNIADFFDLCLYWASVVHAKMHQNKNATSQLILTYSVLCTTKSFWSSWQE